MSNRVAGQAFRIAAFAGLLLGSASLAGCSSLGLGLGGDVTGSTGPVNQVGGSQAMPMALQPIAPQSTRVAAGPYIPPEDIDGGGSGGLVTGSAPPGVVSTTALPPLSGKPNMSAQPQLANPDPSPRLASLGPGTPPHNLSVVPANAYTHTIESGESLYTIARKYNVTAQAIMQANSIASPDKIYVGQKLVIPGMTRPQPVVAPATKVASIAPVEAPLAPTSGAPRSAAVADPVPASPTRPVQVAKVDPAPVKVTAPEPQMSGADKFRWPVSGKVTTDFIASKGTGINIDAPQGSPVRAAENGTVIYVGSGVEGYGNLILIRHPNGYVSAYAHLGSTSVNKGDNVSRGDGIGTVGMTGSVSRPQLHFELRQGATPVDPIPLLAG
jgi:murein DD-endopeptidase MepM/ murein hydrolase activator NlpD